MMMRKPVCLMVLISGLLLLTPGCRTALQDQSPQGVLVSRTDCLATIAGSQVDINCIDCVLECLSYQSQPGGVLILQHEGAVFNCEPGEISSTVSISGDTIEIHEFQSQAGVHCICAYNLEYRLSNLIAPVYHLNLYTYDNRLLQIDIRTETGSQNRVCQDSPL